MVFSECWLISCFLQDSVILSLIRTLNGLKYGSWCFTVSECWSLCMKSVCWMRGVHTDSGVAVWSPPRGCWLPCSSVCCKCPAGTGSCLPVILCALDKSRWAALRSAAVPWWLFSTIYQCYLMLFTCQYGIRHINEHLNVNMPDCSHWQYKPER